MEQLDDNALNIYTDGSMREKPRRGGFAFRFVTVGDDGHELVFDFSPNGSPGANNQEMELKACVEALKLASGRSSPVDLAKFTKAVIYTDSTYVHKHFETARHQWSKRGWMRRDGPPVLHAELWRELNRMRNRIGMPVHIKWIKGKSSPHAKAVDKLAKDSAERPFGRPSTVRSVRRKLSDESVEPGSVGVEGQRIDIRIIAAEYLRLQRCWRYKYEVMSEDSPYFEKVDFVFSDEPLRHRHIYAVLLNDNAKYPRIEEVIGPALSS